MTTFYSRFPPPGSASSGGITSINADTTAAQVIAAGSGISVSSVSGTTTISSSGAANAITALTGAITATGPGSATAALVATTNATLATLSALTTASSLATVGTITSGTWSATTIAVTKGGTGTTTQFTQGSAIFAGASGVYAQDNSKYFYDATNHRLGLGNAAPATTLDVTGIIRATGTSSYIRVPNMTATQRDAISTAGIAGSLIYNTTDNAMNVVVSGFGWLSFVSGPASSVNNNIAVFTSTGGGSLGDSGVGITSQNVTGIHSLTCQNLTAQNNNASVMTADTFSNNAGTYAEFSVRRARGTIASPIYPVNGDTVGDFGFYILNPGPGDFFKSFALRGIYTGDGDTGDTEVRFQNADDETVASFAYNKTSTFYGIVDLANIAAGSPNLNITATSDTPTVTWGSVGETIRASAAPAGYIEITVGGNHRYIPFWA